MPSYPKNYPFYSWMPKPLGIIILLFFFLPILTVGGVYSVNSTEMMSGLGIISEHIQFANFVTSIGMAAFAPFLYQLVCVRPVSYTHLDVYKRQGSCCCCDSCCRSTGICMEGRDSCRLLVVHVAGDVYKRQW